MNVGGRRRYLRLFSRVGRSWYPDEVVSAARVMYRGQWSRSRAARALGVRNDKYMIALWDRFDLEGAGEKK